MPYFSPQDGGKGNDQGGKGGVSEYGESVRGKLLFALLYGGMNSGKKALSSTRSRVSGEKKKGTKGEKRLLVTQG